MTCPSCGGLNTSCPDGCGRDPKTGELNGTRLIDPKREVAIADLNHLLSFPRLGAWGMEALIDTLRVLVPEAQPSTMRE